MVAVGDSALSSRATPESSSSGAVWSVAARYSQRAVLCSLDVRPPARWWRVRKAGLYQRRARDLQIEVALVDVEGHDLCAEVVPIGVLGGMRCGCELRLEPGLAAVGLRDDAHLVVRGEGRIRIREPGRCVRSLSASRWFRSRSTPSSPGRRHVVSEEPSGHRVVDRGDGALQAFQALLQTLGQHPWFGVLELGPRQADQTPRLVPTSRRPSGSCSRGIARQPSEKRRRTWGTAGPATGS